MERAAYTELIDWKKRPGRKPLIIQGARQVGKTYLIRDFAKREYRDCVYLNFEETPDAVSLFDSDLGPSHLIETLGVFIGRKIHTETTLIVFDEIQICPRALTSLKYFCEEGREYHCLAAGSLLGVGIGKKTAFPVGKVEFLNLNPLTFFEYLAAMDNVMLKEYLEKKQDLSPIPEALHNRLMEALRLYFFLGGMPIVVRSYAENKDVQEARRLQKEILEAYTRDFSKYSTPSEAIRVSEIWQSIPRHLFRENKKFQYGTVRKGGRAAYFESAIEWLRRAGLIITVEALSTAKLPLHAYVDPDKFKVYMFDNGILGALVDLEPSAVVQGDRILSEFNGVFTENFVAAELAAAKNEHLHYWKSEHIAEVDFIFSRDMKIIPLEVKSGLSKDTKGLRVFAEKFNSDRIFRTSPRNFTVDNDFVNIPLYAVGRFRDLCMLAK